MVYKALAYLYSVQDAESEFHWKVVTMTSREDVESFHCIHFEQVDGRVYILRSRVNSGALLNLVVNHLRLCFRL